MKILKYVKYGLAAWGLLILGYKIGAHFARESHNAINGDGPIISGLGVDNMVVVPAPNWAGETRLSILGPLGLEQTLKESNGITDTDSWLESNGLQVPVYDINPGSGWKPPNIQDAFGAENKLIKGIQHEDHNIFLYGPKFFETRYMVITNSDNTEALYVLDLKEYQEFPRVKPSDATYCKPAIRWAEMRDLVLYFSFGHNSYSSSTYGKNAYLAAFNLLTSRMLWTSKPLTCNSSNFLFWDNHIICGYGYSDEPDYLYSIDKSTGKRMETIRLASGPEWIFKKGSELFVRTYDKNYKFRAGY